MSECKDCIHYKLCDFDGTTAEFAGGNAQECRFFEDESDFIPFPCSIGDKVYRIGKYYDEVGRTRRKVFERNVVGINVTAWDSIGSLLVARDFGKTVFFTKEEAESALAERMKQE